MSGLCAGDPAVDAFATTSGVAKSGLAPDAPLFSHKTVLQWPIVHARKPSDLPAPEQLSLQYAGPQQFARLQAALLAHEVHAQLMQALEHLATEGGKTGHDNDAIRGLLSANKHDSGSGSLLLTLSLPRSRAPSVTPTRGNSDEGPAYRPNDVLLLSQRPLKHGLEDLVGPASAAQHQAVASGSGQHHCLALVRRAVEREPGDESPAMLELGLEIATVWEWMETMAVAQPLGRSEALTALVGLPLRREEPPLVSGQVPLRHDRHCQAGSLPAKPWYMTPLLSLATELRVASALQGFESRSYNPAFMSRLLRANSFGLAGSGVQGDLNDTVPPRHAAAEVSGYLESRGLNPSQMSACCRVLKYARATADDHDLGGYDGEAGKSDLSTLSRFDRSLAHDAPDGEGPEPLLIQGPPGTGKTTTLAAMLVALVEAQSYDDRVLACAPTNAALGEVGRRVLAHIHNKHRLSDFVGMAPSGAYPARVLSLSGVVVVAGSPLPGSQNQAAAKLEHLLAPISLRPRVERLKSALGRAGLVPSAGSLLNKLSGARHLYAEWRQQNGAEPGSGFLGWLMGWLPNDLTQTLNLATTLQTEAPPSLFVRSIAAQVRAQHFSRQRLQRPPITVLLPCVTPPPPSPNHATTRHGSGLSSILPRLLCTFSPVSASLVDKDPP